MIYDQAIKGLTLVHIRILRCLYHYRPKISSTTHISAVDLDEYSTSDESRTLPTTNPLQHNVKYLRKQSQLSRDPKQRVSSGYIRQGSKEASRVKGHTFAAPFPNIICSFPSAAAVSLFPGGARGFQSLK